MVHITSICRIVKRYLWVLWYFLGLRWWPYIAFNSRLFIKFTFARASMFYWHLLKITMQLNISITKHHKVMLLPLTPEPSESNKDLKCESRGWRDTWNGTTFPAISHTILGLAQHSPRSVILYNTLCSMLLSFTAGSGFMLGNGHLQIKMLQTGT